MENQNAQSVQTTQAAASAANSQPVAGNQQGAVTVSAEDIAAALDARHQRTERSVIRSFAERNGVSVEEITKLVSDYKAQQAAAIPADVQQRIDERLRTADNRLISAEVRAVGTELHIIDIDAAFALMDKSGVKVGEDGSVTGVKEALEALTAAKPYLVNGSENADFAARLESARKSGNHNLATAIISEAAAKGILLR